MQSRRKLEEDLRREREAEERAKTEAEREAKEKRKREREEAKRKRFTNDGDLIYKPTRYPFEALAAIGYVVQTRLFTEDTERAFKRPQMERKEQAR